jgi:hypothetical protein
MQARLIAGGVALMAGVVACVVVGTRVATAEDGRAAAAAGGAPATKPVAAGKSAEVLNFSLIDQQGRYHELRKVERAGGKVVVLFFTGSGCPIGRQNAPKLQAVADAYSAKGVTVWLINATPANDPDPRALDFMFGMGGVAPRGILGDRYPIKGMRGLVGKAAIGDDETLRRETLETLFGPAPLPPILQDEHQLVSRYFDVSRTGETIAIDLATSRVVYRGAVDDQFTEGAKKPAATKKYLVEALEEHLAGKPVTRPRTRAAGCVITYQSPKPEAEVSYAKDVAPLLQRKCVSCHSPGQIGPFAMSDHRKVKGWSAMIRETVLERRMPPWHADPRHGTFENDRSLTGAEANLLMSWIEQGAPRGEGEDPLAAAGRAAKPVNAEWTLGQPDFVVRVPKQEIPATGVIDYRYVDTDFEMPRDGWLRAAVTRPGNPAVVHHIIVRVRYPAGYKDMPQEAYLFTTWVPGLAEREAPADTGMFLPKGAKFNFEIHYTTVGQPQTDETQVGLYLAKEPPKRRLEVRVAESRALNIPPGAADAQHTATYAFKRAATIYELAPHMHVRGAWMKFDLLSPDGKKETLLSVPKYDFNWQDGYWLKPPRDVPAGSWLVVTGGFDNSAANASNPDATKRVQWGPQSWNEMFMGFFTVADAAETAAAAAK